MNKSPSFGATLPPNCFFQVKVEQLGATFMFKSIFVIRFSFSVFLTWTTENADFYNNDFYITSTAVRNISDMYFGLILKIIIITNVLCCYQYSLNV